MISQEEFRKLLNYPSAPGFRVLSLYLHLEPSGIEKNPYQQISLVLRPLLQ